MKNNFLLFMCFVGLLGIFFLPYKTTVIETDLISKEACNVGTGNVSVNATGKDNTSGIYSWLCYKNGSWVSCPNSTLCKTYSINGWNDYTMIKAVDTAGNESKSMNLYNSTSYNFSGDATGSSLITLSADKNAVSIIGKSSSIGSINSVTIKDTSTTSGKVYVSGYPAAFESSSTQPTTSKAEKTPVYEPSCSAGVPDEINCENDVCTFKCVAKDYRVQNATCYCVFKKENGKYTFGSTTCVRTDTYCSDEYAENNSDDEIFKIITNRTNYYQDCNTKTNNDCYNSNLYTRPSNSVCYTYYKKINGAFEDINTYNGGIRSECNSIFESPNCYYENIKEAINNGITPLPARNDIKKLMINASKNSDTICGSGFIETDDYYSSNDKTTLCQTTLLNKLNSELNSENPTVTGTGNGSELIVPIVSSATCKFQSGKATISEVPSNKPNDNSVTDSIGGIDYYFYCNDGSKPVKNGDEYYCTGTKTVKTTTYKYNWTVNYYKKK
jgi:hypothetical protein